MILSAYWEHISLLLAKQLNFDFSLNYKVTVLGNFNTIYCSVYWQSSKYAKAEVAALPQHWQRQPCVGLERKLMSTGRLPRYPVQAGRTISLQAFTFSHSYPTECLPHLRGIFEDVPSWLWETLAALHRMLFDTVSLLGQPTAKQPVNQSVCESVSQLVSSSFSQLAIHSSMYFLPFCAAAQNFRFNALWLKVLRAYAALIGVCPTEGPTKHHQILSISASPSPAPLQHVVCNFNVHWSRCRRW